jgi:hypothetical protein
MKKIGAMYMPQHTNQKLGIMLPTDYPLGEAQSHPKKFIHFLDMCMSKPFTIKAQLEN